ncbi:MAG: DUF2059 domain-containing protein [Rhodovulum sp.]|nr:DUF2059 domain-containing protein [Rhodovulum sp.]
MKPAAIALAATLALPGQSAAADPADDAAYIVSQALTPEMFDGMTAALGPLVASAMTNDLRNQGITVSDMDAVTAITFEILREEFSSLMSAQVTQLYLENFSPLELSDIATFYRSETGQAMLRKTPRLMQEAALMGQSVAAEAANRLGPRIAERLVREGIGVKVEPQ